MAQEIRIFVPRETSAVSLGADEIAARIGRHIERKRLDATVVRNGSWGMCWLEPLVEVQFEDQRVAYGPVIPEVLDELLAAVAGEVGLGQRREPKDRVSGAGLVLWPG